MPRFIRLSAMLLLLVVCAGPAVQATRAADLFTDPDGHFSFMPPDGYQPVTTQQISRAVQAGGNALGVSSLPSQPIVAYRSPLNTANANVAASMLPDPNMTLDDAITVEREVLGSLSTAQITLDDPQMTMLGVEDARRFTYTLTVNGIELRGEQFVALHNGTAYFVTFTALAAIADRSFADMQSIVDSFMFLD